MKLVLMLLVLVLLKIQLNMKNMLKVLLQIKVMFMVLVLMLELVHRMLQEKVINMIQLVQCLIMLMLIVMEKLIHKNLDLLCVQFKICFVENKIFFLNKTIFNKIIHFHLKYFILSDKQKKEIFFDFGLKIEKKERILSNR